jgi:O-antigen ligase
MLKPYYSTKKPTSLKIEIFGDKGWGYFWETRFLPRWLPLIIGLGMALVLARFIVNERWHLAIPTVFAIPAVIIFNRYPFVAIILWAFFVQLFISAPTSAERFIYWILHRGVVPGALLVVILSDWLNTSNRKPIKLGGAELAALIFVGLIVLNIILFSFDTTRTLIQFYDLIFVPISIYWLIRMLNPSEQDLKRFLWVALFVVLVQATIGMLSWFSPASVPTQWQSHLAGERTVGTVRNVAVYTSTLLFFSLLLLQYGVNSTSNLIRLGTLFIFGLALFCVFISFSRASWLGGIIVLTATLFLYPNIMPRFIIVLSIVTVVFAGTLLAGELAFAHERLTSEQALNSAESRVITNNASIQMIKEKPLMGWGFRNYDRFDRRFQTRVGNIAVLNDGTSHNTYLTIMAEQGLLGFVFYITPLFWWIFLSAKVWPRLPKHGFWSRSLLVSLWVVILHMFIVTSFMDMIRFHEFGTSIWWMTLGFIGNVVSSYTDLE